MERYRVTAESRGEDLEAWSDRELITLHGRLVEESAENERVISSIEEILAEREGVDLHAELPTEMLGDRPPLEGMES